MRPWYGAGMLLLELLLEMRLCRRMGMRCRLTRRGSYPPRVSAGESPFSQIYSYCILPII